jgi:hypothetical protein
MCRLTLTTTILVQHDVNNCFIIAALEGSLCKLLTELFLQILSNEQSEVPAFGMPRELVLIVGPVAGGMLFVAFVGLVIFASMVRKKRSLHGTYSPQKQEYNAPRLELSEMMFKLPPEERLI